MSTPTLAELLSNGEFEIASIADLLILLEAVGLGGDPEALRSWQPLGGANLATLYLPAKKLKKYVALLVEPSAPTESAALAHWRKGVEMLTNAQQGAARLTALYPWRAHIAEVLQGILSNYKEEAPRAHPSK